MPWLRLSDTSADHPIALAVLEHDDADDRILNEVFGFAARCAVRSAQHEQDYVVTVGTAKSVAGSIGRYKPLTDAAVTAGYFSRVELEQEDGAKRPAFKLVEDTELFHMILKAERDWTNQRRRDTGNPALIVPIRLRDGDACRWCGQVVVWVGDRKSARAGQYDHLTAGKGAESPDDMVVACKGCNSARGEGKNPSWDKELLPVPVKKYFHDSTVTWLAKHGHDVTASEKRKPYTAAPAAAPQHASVESPAVEHPQGDAPAGRAPEEAQGSAAERLDDSAAPEADPPPSPDLQIPADRRSNESGFVGTGRDGQVREGLGKGLAGSGRAGPGRGRDGGHAGSGALSHARGKKHRRGKRGGKR